MRQYDSAIQSVPEIPAWSEAPTQLGQLTPADRRYTGDVGWLVPSIPLFSEVSADRPPRVVRAAPSRSPRQPVAPAMEEPPWSMLHAPHLIGLIFRVIEVLIATRVVLKLLAANPAAEFTGVVYAFTDPFVGPFQGVFPNPGGRGSVLELSSILAVSIYALLGRLSVRILARG